MHDRAPYSERLLFDKLDNRFAFKKTQDVTAILEAAKDARDTLRKDTGPAGGRFLGTVPVLIAQQWAKECGFPIGTKGWSNYAKTKLADGEWAKLRIHDVKTQRTTAKQRLILP
jgi:hypothetical protein